MPNGLAPIALFVFNRLEHTKQTIDALLKNTETGDSDLFIFSDAEKNDGENSGVKQVRDYIQTIIGFKSVTVVAREYNFGLARSIIEGVTSLCQQFGKVIVLEDDLVVSKYFLHYMNHGLSLYEQDVKVMQISGYMFDMELNIHEDALFLPFTTSWGWATWANAWESFDEQALGIQLLRKSKDLRKNFDLDNRYPYFKMLESQQSGKTQSWAIRWYLSVFLKQGLVLFPRKSLVKNIGFDGSGENCAVSGFSHELFSEKFKVGIYPNVGLQLDKSNKVLQGLSKPKFKMSSLFRRVKFFFRAK